ncbi:MAG: ADP-ribose-binding protein [Coriobacteriia bacterium]
MRELGIDGRILRLERGDITRYAVDVIVNAANSSLMGGGGVDGAIHHAGGPAILEACRAIVAERGRLPAGEAVITTGGDLPASNVIHTVGPVWQGGGAGEEVTLASAYRASMRLADAEELATIAFPSISTGAYGYPVRAAATVALATVAEELRRAQYVREATFVLFDDATYDAYADALEALMRGGSSGGRRSIS